MDSATMSAVTRTKSGSDFGWLRALLHDRWTLAGFSMAALYAIEVGVQAGSADFFDRFTVFANLPIGLAACIVSALAAHRCAPRSSMRRGWAILACAQAAYALGGTAWAFLQEMWQREPFPSVADAFYITFYVLAFAALVAFSGVAPVRTRRLAFALDGAIFVAAAGALAWTLAIAPFLQQHGADGVKGAISLAYACGSGLLVFGMGSLLFRGGGAPHLRPLRGLAAALVVLFAADLLWLAAELDPDFKPAEWPDALYVISQAIQIAAARMQALEPAGEDSRSERDADGPHSTGAVPLLTMLATGALVLWLGRETMSGNDVVLLAAMMLAAGLTGLRQLVSAREVARIHARTTQQETERRFAAIFRQSSDVIVITDGHGRIQYATPSIAHVLGYAPVEVAQMQSGSFLHPDDDAAGSDFFRNTLQARGVSGPREWRLRTRTGDYRCIEAVATNLLDDPAVSGVVITMRDVTERRLLQDRLGELAFTDSLTLLGNRGRFHERVARALDLQRVTSTPLTILFVDVDDFKRVNDGLGHHRGDELLRMVAERLRAVVPEHADIARLGGDEFAVLLHGGDSASAQAIADAIVAAVAAPMVVGGASLTIGASVGIAAATIGDNADDVLRHADIAMYEAKRRGKGRAVSFDAPMQVRASQRLDLAERLRLAIASGGIELNYQPVIDIRTNALTSVEVLARWNDAVHGNIPAGEFVALAEESGQIVALGKYVLAEACRNVGRWRTTHASLEPFAIAVNVSALQLDDEDFFDQVENALSAGGMAASSLVLELTESAMLHPRPQLRICLERLRRIGVRLALDDFGAGYSSLTYLHRFPFDVLKIDRALVERVGYSVDGTALVRAVLAVAEALNLAVVAEGIEDVVQRDELLRIGCWLGQGYLLARPMPEAGLLDWIQRRLDVEVVAEG